MKHIKLFEDYNKELNCPIIKITPEIIEEVNKFNSSEELLRSGGLSIEALDRAAYGFTSEDIKTLLPEQLNIKWKEDYKGVLFEVEYFAEKHNLSFNKAKIIWSEKVNLSEPIEVCYEKDKFWIEDGHHRYFAAKTLKKPLNVNLEIKQNPITKLGGELGYDNFHRCIFNQVKNEKLNESLHLGFKNGKIAAFDIEFPFEINLSESIDDYSKWKRHNITYRGIKNIGEDNGVSGMLGKGLYTVPLSNKSMAKTYGVLYYVYNGKPKNPKELQSLNAWEMWF